MGRVAVGQGCPWQKGEVMVWRFLRITGLFSGQGQILKKTIRKVFVSTKGVDKLNEGDRETLVELSVSRNHLAQKTSREGGGRNGEEGKGGSSSNR